MTLFISAGIGIKIYDIFIITKLSTIKSLNVPLLLSIIIGFAWGVSLWRYGSWKTLGLVFFIDLSINYLINNLIYYLLIIIERRVDATDIKKLNEEYPKEIALFWVLNFLGIILGIVIISWLWHGFSIRIDKQLGAITLGLLVYLGGFLLSQFALEQDKAENILKICKASAMFGLWIGVIFATAYEDTFWPITISKDTEKAIPPAQ